MSNRYRTPFTVPDGSNIEAAVAAAQNASIVIVMVGDNEAEDRDHAIQIDSYKPRNDTRPIFQLLS